MLRGRILVVEDEPLIRMFILDTLEDAGFQAEEAGSAGAAMAKVDSENRPFAAVVIDVGLPDQPGDVLAANLRARWRDLPIIIATGHDRRELPPPLTHDEYIGVLTKPYSSGMLVDALQKLGVTPTPVQVSQPPE